MRLSTEDKMFKAMTEKRINNFNWLIFGLFHLIIIPSLFTEGFSPEPNSVLRRARTNAFAQIELQMVIQNIRGNLRQYPHKEKKSIIADLEERVDKFERLAKSSDVNLIAGIINQLNDGGLSWRAISRSVLSLVGVVEDAQGLEAGLRFIQNLFLDLENEGRIDYRELNEKIQFLSEEKLSSYSNDLEGFKSNYRQAINWILGIEPILSHEIVEEWYEEDADIGDGNQIYFRPKEGAETGSSSEYIRGSAGFYAGGFLKIADTNFVLDDDGVRIFTCTKFKSFFEGQKWGEEIVARTFQRAYELGNLMGYEMTWAFAYWFLNKNDVEVEEWTGIHFEDTERFRIIDSVFRHFGFVHLPGIRGNYPADFQARYGEDLSKLDILRRREIEGSYGGGGGWAMLLRDFVAQLSDVNWNTWFYENRVKAFYEGKADDVDTLWQEIEGSINWQEITQERIANQNRALLSILGQLVEKLPSDDARRITIAQEMSRLGTLLEQNGDTPGLNYQKKVQGIFREVMQISGRENIVMPDVFLRCFTNLFIHGVPDAENLIRNTITRFIAPQRNLSGKDRFSHVIERSYQKITSFFPALDFPAIDEFRDRFSVTSTDEASAGCNSFTKDVTLSLSYPPFVEIIQHESIHSLFEGFLIHSLDEGLTLYLAEKIFNAETPQTPEYQNYLAMAKELVRVAGEEAVIEAYTRGDYAPLRECLGADGVELLELEEMLGLLSKNPDWKNYGIEGDFVSHVVKNRDDAKEKARLREIMLEILSGR